MKTILPFGWLLAALPAAGQIPVVDVPAIAQAIQQVSLATEELKQITTEVNRLGNPAVIHPPGAGQIIESLGLRGVGQTLEQLQTAARGELALRYDGYGLYHAVGEVITTSDGQQFKRPAEDYRKFDAITRTKAALADVLRDTEQRRQTVRDQIKTTTVRLDAATTVSEIQKLHAVLSAQSAELAAIDREREAALSSVLVQFIENQTDQARQAQARHEERVVDFQTATDKIANWLTPNSTPVHIPDIRARLH